MRNITRGYLNKNVCNPKLMLTNFFQLTTKNKLKFTDKNDLYNKYNSLYNSFSPIWWSTKNKSNQKIISDK